MNETTARSSSGVALPRHATTRSVLRGSLVEGVVSGLSVGLSEGYLTAFALAAGASPFVIGLLVSLPILLGGGVQLVQDPLMRLVGGRKHLVTTFTVLQAVTIVGLMALSLARPPGIVGLSVGLMTLYSIFGAAIMPAWGSAMAGAVPRRLRGRYFSLRSQLSMLATVTSSLTAGFFLDWTTDGALWGFAFLFALAAVARMGAWVLFRRLPNDPPQGSRSAVPLAVVRAAAPQPLAARFPMGRFLGLMFFMNFMASLAGAFLVVYQLQDLKLSYAWFSVLQAVATIATLLAITRWGRIADRFGNRPVIIMCSLLLPIVTLLWLPSSPIFFLLAQALSGVAWAGYNLCTTNYLYAVTTIENRARYLAYWNAGMRFSSAGSAFLGGLLIGVLPAIWAHSILTLFVISAIGRGVAALGLLRSLPLVDGEPRSLPIRSFLRGLSESIWPPERQPIRRASWANDAARVFRRALGQTG